MLFCMHCTLCKLRSNLSIPIAIFIDMVYFLYTYLFAYNDDNSVDVEESIRALHYLSSTTGQASLQNGHGHRYLHPSIYIKFIYSITTVVVGVIASEPLSESLCAAA